MFSNNVWLLELEYGKHLTCMLSEHPPITYDLTYTNRLWCIYDGFVFNEKYICGVMQSDSSVRRGGAGIS